MTRQAALGLPAEAGLFIVFEGGDGVGKTTQVRRLDRWLSEAGHRVLLTHEPGATVLGQRIRQVVLDPSHSEVDLRAEALLLAADKAQHLYEVVRPALAVGMVVVCDRYVDSMIAYQGAGRELGVPQTTAIVEWATGGLVPDLTVLLDVAPDEAVDRKVQKDRLEGAGAAFHERVRQEFLERAAAEPERYLVLPARDSIDAIAAAVRKRVTRLL